MFASSLLLFARSLAANPRAVSAIAPSSPALADLITSEINPSAAPVLELGPGTGVFTEALLRRGIDESDLTLVEYGSEFATARCRISTRPSRCFRISLMSTSIEGSSGARRANTSARCRIS